MFANCIQECRMSEYQEIFVQRGQSYDQAMQRYPLARDSEFKRLFDHVSLTAAPRVLDIPSGGGYLKKHLPNTSIIDCYEPCEEFNPKNAHAGNVNLENIKIPPNTYDLAICLAAIHHVDNKARFLKNCAVSLRPSAYFCIADVVSDSRIAHFLDDFAGSHNGTGHKGDYLQIDTLFNIAGEQNLEIVHSEEKACPWVFQNTDGMLDFCRLLFGLRDVSDELLKDALQHYIGIGEADGKTLLDWKLLYVTLQKPPTY